MFLSHNPPPPSSALINSVVQLSYVFLHLPRSPFPQIGRYSFEGVGAREGSWRHRADRCRRGARVGDTPARYKDGSERKGLDITERAENVQLRVPEVARKQRKEQRKEETEIRRLEGACRRGKAAEQRGQGGSRWQHRHFGEQKGIQGGEPRPHRVDCWVFFFFLRIKDESLFS